MNGTGGQQSESRGAEKHLHCLVSFPAAM